MHQVHRDLLRCGPPGQGQREQDVEQLGLPVGVGANEAARRLDILEGSLLYIWMAAETTLTHRKGLLALRRGSTSPVSVAGPTKLIARVAS